MYDQQSSPMPISKIIKSRLKKHFFDMARLIHQPFQQPTNVKMAWLNSDDPLSISVMKRTSKISKLGESLEIEAIDEFEGKTAGPTSVQINYGMHEPQIVLYNTGLILYSAMCETQTALYYTADKREM